MALSRALPRRGKPAVFAEYPRPWKPAGSGTALLRFQVIADKVFCEKHGVLHIGDLTVDLLETFKADGLPKKMADTSKSTVVAKLRCFLRAAFRRGWISEALADRVTGHKAVYEQKEPYTDNEVELILAEALRLTGGRHAYSIQPATFRLLLELMFGYRLRSGDAVQYAAR
jgi:hypothetical protein